MDLFFHGLSAAVLAHKLGVRRSVSLFAAAGLGMWPDVAMLVVMVEPTWGGLYSVSHSWSVNLPLALLVAVFAPRLAWGGLLHGMTDALTHDSSTHHLLHPFLTHELPIGVSWWEPRGWWLWATLWLVLLASLCSPDRWLRPRGEETETESMGLSSDSASSGSSDGAGSAALSWEPGSPSNASAPPLSPTSPDSGRSSTTAPNTG